MARRSFTTRESIKKHAHNYYKHTAIRPVSQREERTEMIVKEGIKMVTIQEVKTTDELVHMYPGQSDPQPCYVELDLQDGVMTADWNSEIGNAIPFTVYHGHVRRYSIPSLSADAANDLMRELLPLAERVVAGYESVWDGHNNVAILTDDASEANDVIEEWCQQEFDGNDVLEYVPGDSWCNEFSDDISEKTDDELESMAKDAEGTALKDGYVVDGMLEALSDIRERQINQEKIE